MILLCLFTRQRALKLGYFYWLRIKNLNHLHTDLSLCYLKHTKFYVENRAPFIQISSIASFKPFLIAWLWVYCTFPDSSVVRLKSSPWPKYTKYRNIFHKKSCSTIKLFFFFTNVLYWTVLSTCKYQKKNRGHRACFLTKCHERWTWFWDRSQDGESARRELGRDTK